MSLLSRWHSHRLLCRGCVCGVTSVRDGALLLDHRWGREKYLGSRGFGVLVCLFVWVFFVQFF